MSDSAELSSIHSSLEELAERLESIARRHDTGQDDSMASQLFEIDRSLRAAIRQLERLRSSLR